MNDQLDPIVRALFRKIENMERVFIESQRDKDEGFYSVQEFSKLTGLDEDTITLYCRQEDIGAVKVKGSWLVLKSEFRRLVTEAVANNQDRLRRTGKRDAAILNHLGIAK